MSDPAKAKWVLSSNSISQLPDGPVAADNVFFHRFTPKEFLPLSSKQDQGGDRRPLGFIFHAWYCDFDAWHGTG